MTLQKYYSTIKNLQKDLVHIIGNIDGDVEVHDEQKLRASYIDKLVYTSAFAKSEGVREYAQNLIRKIARFSGAIPSSIHNVYMAIGKNEINGFTVPAMNIRMLTYDVCRRVFKLAQKHNIGAFVFEIANTEQNYTDQQPSEYSASVLAAAVKERFKGPIFIQGDHYQFKRDIFTKDKDSEINRMKDLIKRSVEAEFYNIDIDGSTLVDLGKGTVDEQQKNNYEMTGLMVDYIRSIEPKGITISIGGEIGHIGGINSTVSDFEAFMNGLINQPNYKEQTGISKASAQTGTSHGGVLMPDGTMQQVDVDFSVLHDISEVAHSKYNIGGAVQHGASTLPEDLFNSFPQNGALEIHLATGFQNIFFDNLPDSLKQKMYTWIRENLQSERLEGQTDEQFIYTLRKKAHGPFKIDQWMLSDSNKKTILDSLESKFELLFDRLNVFNTIEIVKKHVQ
ncbi:aldolase [Candidatus Roizmanbacteria bacterium RIFCSPLOWO2_02_FULL_37_19]|uniref:Aldolase n=1 Tax=Candidatus Roizmanbacteria bacterium RIFCSPHIGHO2_02_FULL_37_24 TaxID=1802037 RepID=A0A1F7GWZ6_9BACT|nr:MAG: aldolase [Candidatus Roizmanbacteria bacterium RIFCSPHIGHO2_01_FULL_38_41]OGK23509.1 MAG: aldolase [Candidatus Roizmanbacteria bacterium RIFCSPHIGHO2_02_FULL_37_24]OGK33467.1 MAG: aldolase [Candidatus Roizmanbacteria bacterium RIFCSPHIGHO2_12_FULL_37_23]OGK45386.1 MAG: aldolase [Candidatus Roizmanbacteria bacterium RIFCSPLOWO2_01_FULL_37_57]OGK54045.1 MAG: aldolase [Candidatus Roizmanbacteria bacterium RIFCSPLOWO2_02_FULL_37_19]OGK59459.1 MAG: aldolase [Candidatus Roizmanbacteria bacte